ncbi:hypothetical protein [Variovorax sp. CF079]|uniref:hypothetical protein n=1 Tax=Variovorax sp. CF079 TaxID=1882774 RepID=UPI001113936E|nr:hypothetical protein [Variovorax sp. CF079]
MKALVFSHLVRTAALGLAFGLGAAGPVAAETLTLPAGLACSFALQIDFSGTRPEVREFRDKDGNLVKTIQAGKGFQLTFTNLNNGTTLSLKTAGSVTKQTFNPDGTTTFVTTGHNVLILFPSDVPPGPTTTLTLGRVVFTVDNSTQVFTLLGTSGRTTDICAVLLS